MQHHSLCVVSQGRRVWHTCIKGKLAVPVLRDPMVSSWCFCRQWKHLGEDDACTSHVLPGATAAGNAMSVSTRSLTQVTEHMLLHVEHGYESAGMSIEWRADVSIRRAMASQRTCAH